ncbi:MAG: phosphoribosylanthranilate isomerase [Gemmatimonadaceae bacterium]|jgi:phosphoribosylanthranilate isomerase|nr:phosphoribosylanthranilate isomerase [Gemmatimonadaceae bacterium]MCC6431140.1 phosphoribosylanthranilate isomerase [Gemmatimonadaceae bacterium]
MTQIKICGLTSPADAAQASRAGAAYVGVILAGGPRLLSVERAGEVLNGALPGVRRVAVFGAQDTETIRSIANELTLDVIQLHGDPTTKQIDRLRDDGRRAVWPVLRVEGTVLPSETLELARAAGTLVLDAKVMGQLGGTGVPLDWAGLAGALARMRAAVTELRLVLAGGLRPGNVTHAINVLLPDVVDVSSGVEQAPGIKDASLVEQFVSAVTAAKGIQG